MTSPTTTATDRSTARPLAVDLPDEVPLLSPRAARLLLTIIAARQRHESATRDGRTLAA